MIVGFTLLYYFMPSTQVNWSSALLGGTFTGVLWQFNSMYSIIYASSVVSYSKMYGFLAAIPILLLGLYLSWMLVLMGCQVAFTWQNRKFYVQHKFTKTIGQKDKELAALRIMTAMGKRFDRGETPYTVKELGDALFLPGSLVQEVLRQFVNTGLAVQSDHEQFLPCLPLDKLSCHRILSAFWQGRNELAQDNTPGAHAAVEVYRSIQAKVQEASEKITIRDILRKEEGS
jgi:membrane protein